MDGIRFTSCGVTLDHDDVIPLIPEMELLENHNEENSLIPSASGSSSSHSGEDSLPLQILPNHDNENAGNPNGTEVIRENDENAGNPNGTEVIREDDENAGNPNATEVIRENDAVSLNNVRIDDSAEPEVERSLISRIGPAVQDYLLEFLEYLRVRTGFRPNHFRAPTELQRTMERMERSSLPLQIWHSLMNTSMRLISLNEMNLNAGNIVDVIMRVVSVIADYYMENFLAKTVLWLLNMIGSEYLTAIVIGVYHFFFFSVKKIWAYVMKKLTEYGVFVAEKMHSHLQITHN